MENNKKTISIIGAGLGGLSAGIYGQLNGFDTQIYEMAPHAGGQCTSWVKNGYVFDCCIHHLMGCKEGTKINDFWKEIGAMPIKMDTTNECVAVASSDGKMFFDYYDVDKLREHLLNISPKDSKIISEYIEAIKYLAKNDLVGDMSLGSTKDIIKDIPFLIKNMKWFRMNMAQFAERFSDPFLRKAFPLLVYSTPNMPVFTHIMRKAAGLKGDIAWPEGGSRALIAAIVKKYESLGGKISYNSEVAKILTEKNKAVGIKLKSGTEILSDIVISDGDGRKTLMNLLDSKYMDKHTKAYCQEPDDEANWAVHVFLGVNRDLSNEPSSLVFLLDEPSTIAGHTFSSLEMQLYGFDKTFAPQGKGVIKVELVSSYSYWKKLAINKEAYEDEKKKVTAQVISILEKHFKGITSQVETTDVPTLITWERFMNGTHGFCNGPKKPFSPMSFLHGDTFKAPGLNNFYFVGVWNTTMGATFANAYSGKKIYKKILKD